MLVQSAFPSHLELDTPWEPQEIVWRTGIEERHAALRQQVSQQGQTHLVREILVESPFTGRRAVSPREVRETLEYTKTEFDILRLCDFTIEPSQWHTFVDTEGRVRTLSRTVIIDGIYPNPQQIVPGVRRYKNSHREARKLSDINAAYQYIDGLARTSPPFTVALPKIHLVDQEPLYA